MKKVFIDTNIILDLLAKRKEFVDCKKIFSLADNNEIELFISTLSIANSHYILYDMMKIKNAKEIIGKFKVLVNTVSLTDKITELALNDSTFKDFEDGIQYYSAVESKCDIIITRNTKDFKNSKLPVMKPKEFLTIRKVSK